MKATQSLSLLPLRFQCRTKSYMWKTEGLEKDGDGWKTRVCINGDQTNNGHQLYLRGRMPNE